MSLPWPYSGSFYETPEPRWARRRLSLRTRRRDARRLDSVLAATLSSAAAPDERSRLITVDEGAEADCLTVAFMRFAELHGKIVREPESRCGIQTAVRREKDRRQTKIVTLWSRRAAEKFDQFWPRYRAAYGGLA